MTVTADVFHFFQALRAKCCFWLASVMRTNLTCAVVFRGHHLTPKPWIDVRSLESHWHFFAFYLSVGFNAGILLASQYARDTQFSAYINDLKGHVITSHQKDFIPIFAVVLLSLCSICRT